MATLSAGQEGMIGNAKDEDTPARGVGWEFKPSAYNQTTITLYKMMGKCSTHGWDYWENITGDEAGRDVHGTQEAGTVVAQRAVPQDF